MAVSTDLKGSCKGDVDTGVDVEVDVDIDWYFGCSNGPSKSVKVLFNGV